MMPRIVKSERPDTPILRRLRVLFSLFSALNMSDYVELNHGLLSPSQVRYRNALIWWTNRESNPTLPLAKGVCYH